MQKFKTFLNEGKSGMNIQSHGHFEYGKGDENYHHYGTINGKPFHYISDHYGDDHVINGHKLTPEEHKAIRKTAEEWRTS